MKALRLLLSCGTILSVQIAAGQAPGNAPAQLNLVKLDQVLSDFALDPETGKLAGIETDNARAWLYPKARLEGKPVKPTGQSHLNRPAPTECLRMPAKQALSAAPANEWRKSLLSGDLEPMM